MNALELSNKKISIMKRINYLREGQRTNTSTVLLTDEQVEDIIEIMQDSIEIIDHNLSRIEVFENDN